MSFVLSICLAILMFGLIIMIHELGHFVVAKLGGIKVNEFAIGMGPTLLKKQKVTRPMHCGWYPSAVLSRWRGKTRTRPIPTPLASALFGYASSW